MYPYMKVTLELKDELEKSQKSLFEALKGVGVLDQQAWEAAGLPKLLGKSYEEAQAPQSLDAFRDFCNRESGGTNAETKAFVEKLKEASPAEGVEEGAKEDLTHELT